MARRILELGQLTGPKGQLSPVDELVLFDNTIPEDLSGGLRGNVTVRAGEIADRAAVFDLIDSDDISVFHLASVVSAGAEQDFDLALQVNLDGHLNVLEALRRLKSRPRHVFSSSLAAYGGAHTPDQVSDATRQTPQTTYGMTKSVGELLVNDYTRKGFIDGRCGRLSAVIVRPGKPNKAASGFVSGVIREPLGGIDYTLPVDLDTRIPVVGYRSVVEGLLALHELSGDSLGDDRALNLPNVSVTIGEMVESMKRVAVGQKLGEVTVDVDPFVDAMVKGWPTHVGAERARQLGLPKADELDDVVRTYMDDYSNLGQGVG